MEARLATDLSLYLQADHCTTDQRFGDKAACLGDLARRAATALGLDAPMLKEALLRREALGSTGLGNAIALPHARLAALEAPFLMLARLREPLLFEAVDDKPVDIVCLALLPLTKTAEPLNVLACIARRLRDPAALAGLRKARDPKALHAAMTGSSAGA